MGDLYNVMLDLMHLQTIGHGIITQQNSNGYFSLKHIFHACNVYTHRLHIICNIYMSKTFLQQPNHHKLTL